MVGVNAIRARLQLALRAGTAAGAKLATPLKSHRGSFAAQTPRNAIAAGLREIRHVEGAAFRSVLNLVQYLRLFFLKARLARSPAEAKVEAVTFEVVSGLHGGVLLMLEPGEYQIGSTADADIVLRDPGVTPSHAMLAVRRGSVSLEATGGDVTIGHQTVSQGHGCRLKLPLEMSLGQASLRLAYLQSPRAAGLGGRYRLATAGIAACATIAIGLVTFLPGRQTADSAHAVTSESPVRLASSTSFASLDVPSPSEPDAGASRPTPPDQRPPSAPSIDDAM
ncbi:MAG: hypothetical protein JOY90_39330, partial [Bradyrhizobium sp.]|uniref:FHA domain-containing protein n=1 Tax=Bradyrhizobium sp. TaxID=376 RepID=UPI001D75DAC2